MCESMRVLQEVDPVRNVMLAQQHCKPKTSHYNDLERIETETALARFDRAISLNPADAWEALQGVPQLHFVGDKDAVVGPEVARAYVQRFPASKRPAVRRVPGADHGCCWAQQWPALAGEAFP